MRLHNMIPVEMLKLKTCCLIHAHPSCTPCSLYHQLTLHTAAYPDSEEAICKTMKWVHKTKGWKAGTCSYTGCQQHILEIWLLTRLTKLWQTVHLPWSPKAKGNKWEIKYTKGYITAIIHIKASMAHRHWIVIAGNEDTWSRVPEALPHMTRTSSETAEEEKWREKKAVKVFYKSQHSHDLELLRPNAQGNCWTINIQY